MSRAVSRVQDPLGSRLLPAEARALFAIWVFAVVARCPLVVRGRRGVPGWAGARPVYQGSGVPAVAPFPSVSGLAGENTDPGPKGIRGVRATFSDRVGLGFRPPPYFDVATTDEIVLSLFFGVGLMDEVTPPSTVFAVFNSLAGDHRIEVYEFKGHEGGGSLHFEEQVEFVREHLG